MSKPAFEDADRAVSWEYQEIRTNLSDQWGHPPVFRGEKKVLRYECGFEDFEIAADDIEGPWQAWAAFGEHNRTALHGSAQLFEIAYALAPEKED